MPRGTTLYRYAAGALALALTAAGVLLDATRESVSLVGHELGFVCGMRQLFGIPCPACGMTRSVVLTLHGRVADALAVNPAGVPLTVGIVVLAVWLVAARRDAFGPAARRVVAAYGSFVLAVMIGHWLVALAR